MSAGDGGNPVRLRGTKVDLRPLRLDDEDAVLAVIGDDRVTVWLSHERRDRDQVRAMLAGAAERARLVPRTEYYLAVVVAGADELVGFVRIGLAGVRAGKLGYAIGAEHWGQGYATDAVATMISFGFTDLDLHRLSVAIGPDNAASIAVASKLGFQYEGRLRDHVHTNGAWRDSLLYSLLAPEWDGNRDEHGLRPA